MSAPSWRARRCVKARDGRRLGLALVLGLGAFACAPATSGPPDSVSADGAERVRGFATPEAGERPFEVWLDSIGSGPGQTAHTCASGNRDRVTLALCTDPAPELTGFEDLYRALGLENPEDRLVAGTTHSLGLSARAVSAANPRVFVYQPHNGLIPYDKLAAVSFARGEQLVEMVALDTNTLDYNFYLLHFQQACNATRCTPENLLTNEVENGWVGWTLYSDADIEDTPLDCLTCHRPFGGTTHKQLLMRQVIDPWLHWGGFEGEYEKKLCPQRPGADPKLWIPAEGLRLIERLEGPSGKYAGISAKELADAKSGERFAAFLVDAELTVRASPYQPSNYPYAQLFFASRDILCERAETGTSPTWDQARKDALSRGLPVPYYGTDLLDSSKRGELTADRAAFLARHADEDAFDVAMSLLAADVPSAVGFTPRPDDDAPAMLHELCVRCHSNDTNPSLKRARFNAERIDRIDPETARNVRTRIALPRNSPLLMPPLRAGELPDWAIERIGTYLTEHCSDERPGACN